MNIISMEILWRRLITGGAELMHGNPKYIGNRKFVNSLSKASIYLRGLLVMREIYLFFRDYRNNAGSIE